MNTKPVLGFTLRGEKDLNYLSSLHHNHQACHYTPTLFSLSWMNLPKWWNLPYFSSQEMLGLLLSLDRLGYALAVYTWLLLWGVQHISASLTQLRACACKWIYICITQKNWIIYKLQTQENQSMCSKQVCHVIIKCDNGYTYKGNYL